MKRVKTLISVLILTLILLSQNFSLTLAQNNAIVEHIFSLPGKHPIQKFLEKHNFSFNEPEYLPLENILYHKDDPANEMYDFTLEKPEEAIFFKLNFPTGVEDAHYTLELIYPNGKRNIYHDLSKLIVHNLEAGKYQFKVIHPVFKRYRIDLKRTQIKFTGLVFISPQAKFSGEELAQLKNFVKKGGNLVIVGNPVVSKEFGVTFAKREIQTESTPKKVDKTSKKEPKDLFLPKETIEFIISDQNKSSGNFLPAFSITEGDLIQRLIFLQPSGYNQILFFSPDLFRLDENDLVLIIKNIFSSEETSKHNQLLSNIQFPLSNLFSLSILKSIILLLITFILIVLFSKQLINFYHTKDKFTAIKDFFLNLSNRLRQGLLDHFYHFLAAIFILCLSLVIGIYYFYSWYTTSSGLDLFPNFKIKDFLANISIFNNLELIYEFTVMILILFSLFLTWLLWDRVKLFISPIYIVFMRWIDQWSRKQLTYLFVSFALVGTLFLYSLFFGFSKASIICFILFIFLLLVHYLFYFIYKKNHLDTASLSLPSRQILSLLYCLIALMPLFLVLKYITSIIGPLESREYRLTSTADFYNPLSPIKIIDGGSSILLSSTTTTQKIPDRTQSFPYESKNYKIIKKFPVTFNFSFDLKNSLEKLFDSIVTINLHLKSSQPLWFTSGQIEQGLLRPLYLPDLNQYNLVKHFNTISLYSQKDYYPLTQKNSQLSLEETIKQLLPYESTIALPSLAPTITAVLPAPSPEIDLATLYQSTPLPTTTPTSLNLNTHLTGSSLTFFTYLHDNLDLTMQLQRLNRVFGSLNFYLILTNPANDFIKTFTFDLPSNGLGFEGQLTTQNWRVENLPSGFYKLILSTSFLSPTSDPISSDYILKNITVNSSKLILKGDIETLGNDSLYFVQLSKYFDYQSPFSTNFSFFDMGGNLEGCNQEANSTTSLAIQCQIDTKKTLRLTFPSSGGKLTGAYNFYSFTNDSWFYPYSYYFTDKQKDADMVITPYYEKPKLSSDDFITANVSFLTNSLSYDWLKKISMTIYNFESPSSFILLDWMQSKLSFDTQGQI